ncbi:MAG: HPF/RaiA family ribosome-associated protein [Caldimonas sp.]
MQLLFKSHDPQADEMRDVAQRRMRFVFRRLDWLAPTATVRLSDVNGPRGGIDKRCQVEINSEVAGSVVVTSVARDWRTALDNALARAARFLMRQWRRGNDNRRRQRAIPLSHDDRRAGCLTGSRGKV